MYQAPFAKVLDFAHISYLEILDRRKTPSLSLVHQNYGSPVGPFLAKKNTYFEPEFHNIPNKWLSWDSGVIQIAKN